MEAPLLESFDTSNGKVNTGTLTVKSLQAVLLLVLKTHRGYFSTTWAEREENTQALESFTDEPDVCVEKSVNQAVER